MKKYYLISYDISKDKARTKVSDLLKNFGTRCQFSLFICKISLKEFSEIKEKIDNIINKKIDSVFFIPLEKSILKKIATTGKEKYCLEEEHSIHFL